MLDHLTIRVADRDASERFYTAVLATLGHGPPRENAGYVQWGGFTIAQADADHPPTRDLHIGFSAPSRAAVDAFWQAGVDAGHADDGRPGPRPQYVEDYYGGFLRDGPPGVGGTGAAGDVGAAGSVDAPADAGAHADNSVEAASHGNVNRDGILDHLWIGVADLAATRAFYATIAPHAGLRVVADQDQLLRLRATSGEGGSITLVADGRAPTAHVHFAFPADANAAVDAFHAAAVAAGHVSDGAPGLRPEYHADYYGAFVLDPDGNSVELVNQNGG